MKSILYILIFSFFSSILPSKELAKLPFLFEHYQFHKKLDNSISIIDFIELHYTACQNIFGDEKEDLKLPFKSGNENAEHTSLQFIDLHLSKITFLTILVKSYHKKLLFYFIDLNFSKAIYKLLQPPKIL